MEAIYKKPMQRKNSKVCRRASKLILPWRSQKLFFSSLLSSTPKKESERKPDENCFVQIFEEKVR